MKNQSLVDAWKNLNIALNDSKEYNDKILNAPLYLTPIIPKISSQKFRPQSAAANRYTRKDRPESSYKNTSIRIETTSTDHRVRPSSSHGSAKLVRTFSNERNSQNRLSLLSQESPSTTTITKRPTSSTANRSYTIRPFFSSQTAGSQSKSNLHAVMSSSALINTSASQQSPMKLTSSAVRVSDIYSGRYSSGDPEQLMHSFTLGELSLIYRSKCLDNNVAFNPSQLPSLFEKFRTCSKKRTLQFDYQSFGPQSGIVIAEILARNQHFTKIQMGKNFISDAGACAFAEVLRTNDTIIELDLSSNNISYKGAILLFEALASNETVIAFKLHSEEGLNRNKLDTRGTKPLAEVLKKNCTLQFLNLKALSIDSLGASLICSGLENNRNLVFLDLSWNEIGPSLCKSLVQALPICALLELNIAGNKIGDKGMSTLSNVFWSTVNNKSKLKKLNVSDNRITWQGATSLMNSLSQNQTVEVLILDNNYLGGRAVICMVNFLWENFTLKHLSMMNCQLEVDACIAITSGLDRNKSLQVLQLSRNFITSKGAQVLAEAFSSTKCGIKEFELQSCGIRDDGGVALAKAIQVNRNIERVNLRENNLFDDSGPALVEALANNPNIKKLLLDRNPMDLKHSLEIQRRVNHNVNAKAKGKTSVYKRKITDLNEFALQKFVVADEQAFLDQREVEIKEEIKFETLHFNEQRQEEIDKYNQLENQLQELSDQIKEIDNFRKDLEKEIAETQQGFLSVKTATENSISEVVHENFNLENEIKRIKDGMKSGRVTLFAKKEILQQELQNEIKTVKTLEATIALTQKEVMKMSIALETKMLERQKTMVSQQDQEEGNPTNISPASSKKNGGRKNTMRKSMVNFGPKRSISADKLTSLKRSSAAVTLQPRKSNIKAGK